MQQAQQTNEQQDETGGLRHNGNVSGDGETAEVPEQSNSGKVRQVEINTFITIADVIS